MKYERLQEIYVKSDLHAKIIQLKGAKTSDQFLRELLINGTSSARKEPKIGSRENNLASQRGRILT